MTIVGSVGQGVVQRHADSARSMEMKVSCTAVVTRPAQKDVLEQEHCREPSGVTASIGDTRPLAGRRVWVVSASRASLPQAMGGPLDAEPFETALTPLTSSTLMSSDLAGCC